MKYFIEKLKLSKYETDQNNDQVSTIINQNGQS